LKLLFFEVAQSSSFQAQVFFSLLFTMAEPPAAFRAAMASIGLNLATRTAINNQGYHVIGDLTLTDDTTIKKYLAKSISPAANGVQAAGNAAQQVRLPLVAMHKLRAMRYWVLAQRRQGLVEDANDFDNEVAVATLAIMRAEDEFKEASAAIVLDKPTPLTDIHKWTKFWLKFMTYLGRVHGAAKIPLTYLIRKQGEVTAAVLAADYLTIEDRLLATTVLAGSHFALDNVTLYNEFKPLVVDGPGWGFIKKFDKTQNGRGAVLALQAQAEGQSALQTRKNKAYASCMNAIYKGPRKGYSFDNYVSLHQEAHNELMDLEEPVPEAKKVTDFLKGIQATELSIGKSIVLGELKYLSDFEACQQFLGTLVLNTTIQAKAERNVSAVHSNSGGSGSGGSSLVDKVKGGSYSDAQWGGLSSSEKDRVNKYREGAAHKKKNKNKQRNQKRKLAKAKSARENDADGEDDEVEEEPARPKSNAGSQFGSNGNAKKSKKN
jgi:hypothetical protein